MNIKYESNAVTSNKHASEFEDSTAPDDIQIKHAVNISIFDLLPVTFPVTENFTSKIINLTIVNLKESARGSFGIVYEGTLSDSRQIAVKKVLQDRRYKNRELNTMKILNHNHITAMIYFYYATTQNGLELYLNIIMEFVPQTFSCILKFYSRSKSYLPMDYVKVYIFQLFRGINYMHQLDICHRDIKPQNVLINPSKILLRICDFGSAKKLNSSETNVAYICSRYYRAPELIFGATRYSVAIDVWSAGCVFAEVLLNKPLFPGETSVDQLVEVIKILGTPTTQHVTAMNPDYKSYQLPLVKCRDFQQIFTNPVIPEEAFSLLKETLEYSPKSRIGALKVLAHPFFDRLRDANFKVNSKQSLPPLFNFTALELGDADDVIRNVLRRQPPT